MQQVFITTKQVITSKPLLSKPNFAKDFIIYTNETEEAISGILMQKYDQGNGHPIDLLNLSL